ncbi:mRNA splicing protein [Kickxella alabastrina]|nr:mRNA splicing protein [Kickxella alabastrina]
MSSSNTFGKGKLSREDYKKQKDLDAARKAGTAPAELDEEGNAINPHIPEFMSKAPWYMDTGKLGLQHQRKNALLSNDPGESKEWYARGTRLGKAPKEFKKGACENCGAMSHKTRDCVERPRKRGARWTNEGLMANEVVRDVNLDYDAKRDRWNGYDAEDHRRLMQDWELVEEARKKRKASELDAIKQNKTQQDATAAAKSHVEDQFASSDEDDNKEDEDREEKNGGNTGVKSRSTVRNLRIREDTAKYLRNLDPDSAYYDPKTRSMRENPYAGKDTAQLAYSGDNFIRYSGDAPEVARREVFAWEAGERGNRGAHFQANPTQTALMYEEFKGKRDSMKGEKKSRILAQYGGEEHLKQPPRELLVQQERYVEYSRAGKVIEAGAGASAGAVAGKGPAAENVARTRFKEDVFPMNHRSVYGSWWGDGQWGYACCHQLPRNSYCTAKR